MTDQEKVQLVADVLFHDRLQAQKQPTRTQWHDQKALKALLKALLDREATDQEIQDAENL